MSLASPETACRADVWLWRARLFKTRAAAAAACEAGRLRRSRPGDGDVRLDKPSRTLRPGDTLVFASGGRLVAVRVEALGRRRGPPAEARNLYSPLAASTGADGGEPPSAALRTAHADSA